MKQAKRHSSYSLALAGFLLLALLSSGMLFAAEAPQQSTARPNSVPATLNPPDLVTLPNPALPPLVPGQSNAARWLQLLDQATVPEQWQTTDDCRSLATADRTGMCRLQWRKRGGLSGLRGRYDDYSYDMTLRFVGKHLADHLEFDIDTSPEIRLRYDFE